MKRLRSDVVFLVACLAAAAGWLHSAAATGDSFTWQNVNGGNFITPARNQGGMGSCWSFGAVETLEAKYMLTRNDPTFQIYLSEQNLICDVYQSGGPPGAATAPFETGICTDAELPYVADIYSPLYPLQSGWQQRVVVSTTELVSMPGSDIADVKAELKAYGPLAIDICPGDFDSQTLGTGAADHDVLAVGYVDDPTWAGGGYLIVKNSWGTSPNNGFCYIAYANETRVGAVQGLEGLAYFTGTMYFSGTDYSNPANLQTGINATATWKGGLNKNVWDTSTANWQNNGTNTAFTWVNQEVGATFDGSSSARDINIAGTVIAHSLTFNAPGYELNGGALTVTAGGITANQSVTLNTQLTVGAPQSWTVAAGQNLTAWSIHTVISDLTLNGAGSTTITGNVDGGGAANLEGQPAGRIIQNGPGLLAFTAAASCADTIVYNGGTLALGMTGTNFSGSLDLAGPLLTVQGSSTVSGGTLASGPFGVGPLTLSSGTLEDDGGGRTLATAVTINGNVTLSGAGSTGVSFAPLGLATPNAVTMNNSPTITVAAPTTIGDPIAASSGFTMAGPSVLVLTATAGNAFGGPITVSGGTLQGTAASLAVPIMLANNANVTCVQNANATLSWPIRGAGSVVKTGSGMLTLGAPSAYQGTTTIGAGTLQLPAPSVNAGLVVRYSMDGPPGAIANGTTMLDLGYSPNGNNGAMVGSWGSYVAGQFGQGIQFNGYQAIQTPYAPSIDIHSWTNSVWLNVPANTSGYPVNNEFISGRNANFPNGFTGGFDEYYDTDAGGNGSFYIEIPTAGGGWIIAGEPVYPYTLTPGTWNLVTTTVSTTGFSIYVNTSLACSGAYSGTPALMTSTSDFLSIGSGAVSLAMDEFQLYNTVLSAAQIQKVYQNQALGFGSALPSGTPVQLASGAVFDLNGAAQTIGSLADGAGGGGTVTNSAAGTATLTLAPTGSTTFSGHIQNGTGHVALVINGPGVQVLAASNTYTGGTEIESGILVAANGANGSATGSGPVTLSGGTLASGAAGSISGAVTVAGSPSEIAPGGIGTIGELTVGSLVTASNLTTLDFDLTTPGGSGDLLMISNGLTLAPSTDITFGADPTTDGDYCLIGYGSLTGSLSDFQLPAAPTGLKYALSTGVDSGYIDLVVTGTLTGHILPDGSDPPAPEPSTLALLGAAAFGLLGCAWRRRRRDRLN
jgi:autotransporter-associated beta strand protein